MPFTRIEVAVFSIVAGDLRILLGRRVADPFAGRWALPGGVVRTDLDSSLDAAVERVIGERLETTLPRMKQLCALGGPDRDPRGWGLSIVYWALLPFAEFKPRPGKRLEALRWEFVTDAIHDRTLAFDHADVIARALTALTTDVESMALPFDLLPQHFTLGELQATCEILLGRTLDKSSFRRKLSDRELVIPIDGEMKVGPFRPAQIYCRK